MSHPLVFPWGTAADEVNAKLPEGGLAHPYKEGDLVYTNYLGRPDHRYKVVRMEMRAVWDYSGGPWGFSVNNMGHASDPTTSGWAVWVEPVKDAVPITGPLCGGWWWPAKGPGAKYPHTCPRCGAAAYVGFLKVDCSRSCH